MTKIQWTERTWNPVRGCSRVSEGCRHCYAEQIAARFSGKGQPYEGLAKRVGGEARWTGEVRFVPEKLDEPLRRKKPTMWFVNSMSDLFHERLSDEQIAAVFGVMAACPQHTFQVLTKRPSRLSRWFGWAWHRGACPADRALAMARYAAHAMASRCPTGTSNWPLPNVWLGASVENQATADQRIPLLLRTPAAMRFVSAEPVWIGQYARAKGWAKWDVKGGDPSEWPEWMRVREMPK